MDLGFGLLRPSHLYIVLWFHLLIELVFTIPECERALSALLHFPLCLVFNLVSELEGVSFLHLSWLPPFWDLGIAESLQQIPSSASVRGSTSFRRKFLWPRLLKHKRGCEFFKSESVELITRDYEAPYRLRATVRIYAINLACGLRWATERTGAHTRPLQLDHGLRATVRRRVCQIRRLRVHLEGSRRGAEADCEFFLSLWKCSWKNCGRLCINPCAWKHPGSTRDCLDWPIILYSFAFQIGISSGIFSLSDSHPVPVFFYETWMGFAVARLKHVQCLKIFYIQYF
jgi:hypothetical protein